MGPKFLVGDFNTRSVNVRGQGSNGAVKNLNSVLKHVNREIALALAQNPSLGRSGSSSIKALTGFLVKSLEQNPDCLEQIHSVKVSVSKRAKSPVAFGRKSVYSEVLPVRLQVKVNASNVAGKTRKLRFDSSSSGALRDGSKRSASPKLQATEIDIRQKARNSASDISGFKFSGELALQKGKMVPVNGHGKFADGTSASGYWRVDRTTGQNYLAEGTVVYPTGIEVSGKFLSPKELIKSGSFFAMSLANNGVPVLKEGSVKYPHNPPLIIEHSDQMVSLLSSSSAVVRCMVDAEPVGRVNEQCRLIGGRYGLDRTTNEVFLRSGIVVYPAGGTFSGDFYLPSELANMADPAAKELARLKVPVPKNGTLDTAVRQEKPNRLRLGVEAGSKIVDLLKNALLKESNR